MKLRKVCNIQSVYSFLLRLRFRLLLGYTCWNAFSNSTTSRSYQTETSSVMWCQGVKLLPPFAGAPSLLILTSPVASATDFMTALLASTVLRLIAPIMRSCVKQNVSEQIRSIFWSWSVGGVSNALENLFKAVRVFKTLSYRSCPGWSPGSLSCFIRKKMELSIFSFSSEMWSYLSIPMDLTVWISTYENFD